MSDEKLTTLTTTDNSLFPSINWYENSDISSSVHNDNKKKDILIPGLGPTQGLYDTILTAEAAYPINFTQSEKRFALSVHCDGSNSNSTKIYQFIAKDSEIKKDPCI